MGLIRPGAARCPWKTAGVEPDWGHRDAWINRRVGMWGPSEDAIQAFRRARALAAVGRGYTVVLDTKGTVAIPDGVDVPIEARCFTELRAILDLMPVNPRLTERLARYLMRDDVLLLAESDDPLLVEQGAALADYVSPAAIADLLLVDPVRAEALLRYLTVAEILWLFEISHPVVESHGATLVARLPPELIAGLAAGSNPALRAAAAEAVLRAMGG
jgi:hypothetical protein